VQPQGVAYVVEPQGVRPLGIDQTDHMAPRRARGPIEAPNGWE
jgi:hypothetical protein